MNRRTLAMLLVLAGCGGGAAHVAEEVRAVDAGAPDGGEDAATDTGTTHETGATPDTGALANDAAEVDASPPDDGATADASDGGPLGFGAPCVQVPAPSNCGTIEIHGTGAGGSH